MNGDEPAAFVWWQSALVVIGGLVALYAVLLILLWCYARKHPDTLTMKDALRLLPDLLRLLRSLAADKSQPAGVRAGVVLLLVYLLMPIDVVPDFLPIIGYADDVIIVALMLRFIIRRAGPDPLVKHWPGNAGGLQVVMRLGGAGF
ncbi:YkvA family protein [Arthrobacter sp. HLT1-21]